MTDKKANLWAEKVYYIECPNCTFSEDFPDGGFITNEKWTCEQCNVEYEIEDNTGG